MSGITLLDARELTDTSDILARLRELAHGRELILTTRAAPADVLAAVQGAQGLDFYYSPIERGPEAWTYHFVARDPSLAASVSEYLGWDHDRLDEVLERALADAAAGKWQPASRRLENFRHGLFRHADLEDDVLFPEYEQRTGIRTGGPTQVMRDEHVQIKQAINGMVQATREESLPDLEQWHANLLGVLVEHNMKEEQILYPGTDNLLSDAEREDLILRMLKY
ncbi:MAG: hemerythrin domain-containing protein [Planctomycetes bacterium]|nr:hemerythrin domain-containing protein [Planctomycetota bacterium]MCW8135985.1 hemerythrin domain-containing protein [Planctomycetota bacterium]